MNLNACGGCGTSWYVDEMNWLLLSSTVKALVTGGDDGAEKGAYAISAGGGTMGSGYR